MRMSDIIKLGNKKTSTISKFSRSSILESKEPPIKNLQMKSIITAQSYGDTKALANDLYEEMRAYIQTIFTRASVDFDMLPPLSNLSRLANELADLMQRHDIDIMELFLKHNDNNYLLSHSINVTFMAAIIGSWLNYNKSELIRIIIAAMLHDVGMVRFDDIASLPRRLSKSEKDSLSEHVHHGKEFTEKIDGIDSIIPDTIGSHHKRYNDSEKTPNNYAQIIGIADVFEAMTHSRPYKDMMEPHTAICSIIEDLKDDFNSSIIKAFVDNIGIYPVSSWVKLNTKEIALVIDTNSGFPLDPKVKVLLNENQQRLQHPRIVDLSKQSEISVENLLDNEIQETLRDNLSIE